MHPLLVSTALGLAAAWPVAGLGLALGKAADRLTDDPAPRAAAWNRAVSLPPAVLGLMTAVSLLPEATTAPIYQVVASAKALNAVGAVMDEASARASASFTGVETLAALLILGAVGGLAVATTRQVIGRLRLRRIIRDARPAAQELVLAVRAAARRIDTGRPEVRISDRIDEPLLAGLATPVILLPASLAANLDVDRLTPICAHELAHLKRGDNWRLLFEHLLGGLFWMVPPYALLRARALATREELCDALALEGAPQATRAGYAQSLVAVLKTRAVPTLHSAFTGKGRKSTLMRLKAITEPRRPAGLGRKAALGLVTALAVTAAGVASIALAKQDSPGPNRSQTRISSTDPRMNFTITSNIIKIGAGRLVDGQLTTPDGQASIYHGDVTIQGRLGDYTTVLLNGAPPPAGFDPTKLPKGAVQDVEVTNLNQSGQPKILINVLMPESRAPRGL